MPLYFPFSSSRLPGIPKKVYYSLCLANRTTNTVYGSYEFESFKRSVGVLTPGARKTEGFMPTDPNQKVAITFRANASTNIFARATFEPMKSFPKDLNKSITTTYTLVSKDTIQLGFQISHGGGKTTWIIPGESEEEKRARELGEKLVDTALWGDPADVPRLLEKDLAHFLAVLGRFG